VHFSHQASFYTNAANRPSNYVDAYSLVNARVTWRNTDGAPGRPREWAVMIRKRF
jgi:hypothetical protein